MMSSDTTATHAGRVTTDGRGFVYVDGVKLCRIVDGRVELRDKSSHRAQRRGAVFVSVPVHDLCTYLTDAAAVPPESESDK